MWPADLAPETFQKPVMDYRGRMISLGHLLLKILAMGLPFSGDVLDEIMAEPVVGNVRLLHYPPQKDSTNERQLGGEPSNFFFVVQSNVCSGFPKKSLLNTIFSSSGCAYRLWRDNPVTSRPNSFGSPSAIPANKFLDPCTGRSKHVRRQHW